MRRCRVLQMQPCNYTTYADRFSELASQLRGMNPTHLMYMFLNGFTADYKHHVLLHGATSFAEVQETCRRLDLATRTSQHTAHQRWPPPNVSADHSLGVSPRPVPVEPDLGHDLPAKAVVLLTTFPISRTLTIHSEVL